MTFASDSRAIRLPRYQAQGTLGPRTCLMKGPQGCFFEARSEVEKAMERLKEGRTTVIVAHEIRSIEDADQIVVLSGVKVRSRP